MNLEFIIILLFTIDILLAKEYHTIAIIFYHFLALVPLALLNAPQTAVSRVAQLKGPDAVAIFYNISLHRLEMEVIIKTENLDLLKSLEKFRFEAQEH
jgi:hypothetical protein